mmetsp:Transcript_35472/g.76485  ORF Transcript_35472/g.76485 Transcript_35472/m.76485 type:complete len:282 (+) Transcript_35472:205-1050(+)
MVEDGAGAGAGAKVDPTAQSDDTNGAFFDPLLRPPPGQKPPWSSALLLLLPLRLGIHNVNVEYQEEIREALQHPRCVGILGGRPQHAIYFTGYRGEDDCTLLGLDPHTVFGNTALPPSPPTAQPTPRRTSRGDGAGASVSASSASFASAFAPTPSRDFPSAEYVQQVHVPEFVSLELRRLDPSLALGFYFPDRPQFDAFCEETRLTVAAKLERGAHPLYSVQAQPPAFMKGACSLDPPGFPEEESSDSEGENMDEDEDMMVGGSFYVTDTTDEEDEDYVLL